MDYKTYLLFLQEELSKTEKEIRIMTLSKSKQKHHLKSFRYIDPRDDLFSYRKKLQIKINQIRLKYWYWK